MHEYYMQKALELARLGQYTARPNPMVGCVIVKNNKIVGEGYHACYGEQHAEVMALAQAGGEAKGATCYVTLEPCNHVGKTPPCAPQLVAAGIKCVIIACKDPCCLVNGSGVAYLKAHGIEVIEQVGFKEALQLNRAFFHRMQKNKPWVMVKLAMSLDGKIADHAGGSQWISGESARVDVQKLRASSDAIMIGSHTLLQDNPRLTVRENNFIPGQDRNRFRHPKKVLIDSKLIAPSNAAIFSIPGSVIIYTLQNPTTSYENAEVYLSPSLDTKVDLEAVMYDLAEREVNQLLVEGGGKLVGALLKYNLVNELVLYTAGMILGNEAKPGFAINENKLLSELINWHLISVEKLGNDIKSRWTLE